MVTLRIREIAARKNITNAYGLQKALGLDDRPTTAARLWRGEMKMISLRTIDKLCEALDCQPGQLFRYVPDKRRRQSRG